MPLFSQTPFSPPTTSPAPYTPPVTPDQVIYLLASDYRTAQHDVDRYNSPLQLGGMYFGQPAVSVQQRIIAPPKILPSGTI